MGRKKARKLTVDLERKIQKYYQAQQKLQLKNIPIEEITSQLSPQWDDIINHIQCMHINPDVFIVGKYYFLGDAVTTLDQLQKGTITNYDLFIAELEDYMNHYKEIEENYFPFDPEVVKINV